MERHDNLFDLFKKDALPVKHLEFYNDQKSDRKLKISRVVPEIFLTAESSQQSAVSNLGPTSSSVAVTLNEMAVTDEDNCCDDQDAVDDQHALDDQHAGGSDNGEQTDDFEFVPPKGVTVKSFNSNIKLRSSKILKMTTEQATMTEPDWYPNMPLRNGRKVKDEVLATIVNVGVKAKISINKARRAFMESMRFAKQNYKLSAE